MTWADMVFTACRAMHPCRSRVFGAIGTETLAVLDDGAMVAHDVEVVILTSGYVILAEPLAAFDAFVGMPVACHCPAFEACADYRFLVVCAALVTFHVTMQCPTYKDKKNC